MVWVSGSNLRLYWFGKSGVQAAENGNLGPDDNFAVTVFEMTPIKNVPEVSKVVLEFSSPIKAW